MKRGVWEVGQGSEVRTRLGTHHLLETVTKTESSSLHGFRDYFPALSE